DYYCMIWFNNAYWVF
nr:immunoglobulin light chain junction region [Macaca mulatta]MOX16955.1 immunoglobulin light chain junction region [Macaca mulatta]MOX17616.1 immunoglobulin light chain junction region [Macaca mulatta]MOX18604.1 immunoglobulin light chain junction region [Macaca mulatta]MOX19300.1 immunoglobulin light chain junction region [Macaca mulatta]